MSGEQTTAIPARCVQVRRPGLGETPGVWKLDVTCPACGSPMRLGTTSVGNPMGSAEWTFTCSMARQSMDDRRPDRCVPMQKLTVKWEQDNEPRAPRPRPTSTYNLLNPAPDSGSQEQVS